MVNNGIFCISLDFELHWGRFDKMPLSENTFTYFANTRAAIPQILDLFLAYDMHVTWATVGMLFHKNEQEWLNAQPVPLPSFSNKALSSYEWVKENGIHNVIHFAPELIEQIKHTPNMEIGTHTYSHYYCNEHGQTIYDFKRDLKIAINLAQKNGIQIKSLVFPRNQVNELYLEVCAEVGIETVRTNPSVWFWNEKRKADITVKIARTGDAYLPFSSKNLVNVTSIDVKKTPVLLPASRLYRPWSNNLLLNKLKLQRILHEMTVAAKEKRYYHLWWHPHNFGYHPENCLAELAIILRRYAELNHKYGFQSMSMIDTKDYLLN